MKDYNLFKTQWLSKKQSYKMKGYAKLYIRKITDFVNVRNAK